MDFPLNENTFVVYSVLWSHHSPPTIHIRRWVMVSLPYDGEIYVLNGDNIVDLEKTDVLINIFMGITYTCMNGHYIHM